MGAVVLFLPVPTTFSRQAIYCKAQAYTPISPPTHVGKDQIFTSQKAASAELPIIRTTMENLPVAST